MQEIAQQKTIKSSPNPQTNNSYVNNIRFQLSSLSQANKVNCNSKLRQIFCFGNIIVKVIIQQRVKVKAIITGITVKKGISLSTCLRAKVYSTVIFHWKCYFELFWKKDD